MGYFGEIVAFSVLVIKINFQQKQNSKNMFVRAFLSLLAPILCVCLSLFEAC